MLEFIGKTIGNRSLSSIQLLWVEISGSYYWYGRKNGESRVRYIGCYSIAQQNELICKACELYNLEFQGWVAGCAEWPVSQQITFPEDK